MYLDDKLTRASLKLPIIGWAIVAILFVMSKRAGPHVEIELEFLTAGKIVTAPIQSPWSLILKRK